METYEVESCVRGYHIYKTTWNPALGEELDCQREHGNAQDRYAVAVKCRHTTVGHIPRKISAACSIFLSRSGNIRCKITGTRRFSTDLPQGGLEVPCMLTFQGEAKDVTKISSVQQARQDY